MYVAYQSGQFCLADALLLLAVGGRRTPKRARQVACGAERSHARVDVSGKPLQQPDMAVGIAERGARTIGATLGIESADAAIGADMKEFAHVDPGSDQLVPGGHDVGNDRVCLGGTGRGRREVQPPPERPLELLRAFDV